LRLIAVAIERETQQFHCVSPAAADYLISAGFIFHSANHRQESNDTNVTPSIVTVYLFLVLAEGCGFFCGRVILANSPTAGHRH